ncbi:hypothetical protein LFYK43_12530 [Ligilactobacillus salitolerans]|uniref:Type VII secretion protein, YukD family n=1 Tax=Ligilactobacillus salitolerans TaxID=1808352 RepID=A0A401ITE9_9LACO|nr:EsaB/YukD family protein [Ligilactobacillus salitolerans]GBG94794.1 hypothetical protein LFYK43_12530 [Ligilactobacillus salitolerans]
MEQETAITVGLHLDDQVLDLKLPTKVSIARLKVLLAESLAVMHLSLPAEFELQVLNKPLRLVEHKRLADYPLADGDQLAVTSTQEMKEQQI